MTMRGELEIGEGQMNNHYVHFLIGIPAKQLQAPLEFEVLGNWLKYLVG